MRRNHFADIVAPRRSNGERTAHDESILFANIFSNMSESQWGKPRSGQIYYLPASLRGPSPCRPSITDTAAAPWLAKLGRNFRLITIKRQQVSSWRTVQRLG